MPIRTSEIPTFRKRYGGAVTVLAPWAAGCAPSALHDAAGAQAAAIGELWSVVLRLGTAASLLALLALGLALARGARRARRRPYAAPDADPEPRGARRAGLAAGMSAGLIALLALALIGADAVTGRRLLALREDDPLTITVTGRRWWWEVTYDDSLPWRAVSTANELVLPLGRDVRVELRAAEVAHSFWAPSFAGARDVIPGRPATLWLRAERLGTYAARCVTYCGAQHAHMGLTITVVTPFDFYAWLDSAGRPAREPQTALEQRGRDLFVAGECARCHTIIGTDALGSRGPDLTHLASRPTLAAGTLPNTPATLAAFIADPARVKPGAHMPPSTLAPDDLRAVAEYLASLR